MRKLIAFFVDNHVLTISLFGALMLFGGLAAFTRGVDLMPEMNVPVVAVITPYAGAGPEEISREVSEPIEGALATLPGITFITSTSVENVSSVVVQFAADVSLDQAAIDVSQRVNALAGSLPDGVTAPSVQKFDPADMPIMSIALTASGQDLAEVETWARDNFRPVLLRADGVADVRVVGPAASEVQVLLSPERLDFYGLSAMQVAGAIGASALDVPAGTLTLDGARLQLTARATPTSLAEVGGIRVDPVRGLSVSDVAVVREAPAETTSHARLNGEGVVLLDIRRSPGSNTVATAGAVRNLVEAQVFPPGYTAQVINDSSAFIAGSVEDSAVEMLLATLAVSLIVLVFVGRLGTVFSVVLAIPVSLAGALVVFSILGFTFNIVTLLAITVAIGLVIDDAIVVAESIDTYRAQGLPMREAVLKGAGSVSTAVLAATMSLLAVFIPISLLPGVLGSFFAQFGITLAAAIAFSYLEAMLFLTMRLALSPDPLPPGWRDVPRAAARLGADIRWTVNLWRRWWFWLLAAAAGAALWYGGLSLWWLPALVPALFVLRYVGRLIIFVLGAISLSLYHGGSRLVDVTRDAYVKSLRWALRNSWPVLGAAALMLASLAWVFPQLGFQFQPQADAGMLQTSVTLPEGTPLSRSNEVAAMVEQYLFAEPELGTVQTTVGASSSLGVSSPQLISLYLTLVPKHERDVSTEEYALNLEPRLKELLSMWPEVEVSATPEDAGVSASSGGVSLTIGSQDRELLEERAARAAMLLENSPLLRNVDSGLPGVTTERVFVPDPLRMDGTGLTNADLFQALRLYNVGADAGIMHGESGDLNIIVRADPAGLTDELALLNLPVTAPALQASLPLGSLGSFQTRAAPASISRTNQTYSVSLSAALAAGVSEGQGAAEVDRLLAESGLLDDRVFEMDAAGIDLLGELMTYGPIAFGVALLLNYLAIGSQFNSFRYPLYLLMTVPLALIGALWGLYLGGMNLDAISILGVVMLIGLVTKNAILLLDVALVRARQGVNLHDALIESGHSRFRPIVMTTVTVLVISLPLLLGLGEGSELRRPLGMIILGGVLSSAILTLYVVPAAFHLFERDRFAKAADRAEKKAAPEPALPA